MRPVADDSCLSDRFTTNFFISSFVYKDSYVFFGD